MSVIKIVCQNCGAKYQLPESFHADKAKCKACGTAIDVAVQRDAAAAPAAAPSTQPARAKAKPATAKAKPAEARAAAEPRRAKAAGSSPRSRRARGGDDADPESGGERRGRRSERRPSKKGMSPGLIGGILGGIAVLVVGGIFLFGGGKDEVDPDTQTDVAGAGKTTDPKSDPAAQGTEPETPKPDAGTPVDVAGTDQPDPKEAVQPKPPADTPKKDALESTADVFDPSTLEALSYPDEIAQEKRDEVESLLDEAIDGGLSGTRAKRALEAIGFPALFGIVNRLRTFEYTTHDGLMSAWEFNRLLETITQGTNAGFRLPNDEPSLEDMDWNAQTVKAWQRFLGGYTTEESFKAFLKKKDETLRKNN